MKIEVISNRLERYMTFFKNKNLVFIDSMEFMNSSLEKLVKNLSDNDFKYSTEEFGSEQLVIINAETLNSHISDEDYLTCNKMWSEFNIKIWVIITIIS